MPANITLYEPRLAAPGGFFSYLYEALRVHRGAVFSHAPRPLPRATQPRDHESAWLEIDGKRVLVDMSDHVFRIDLPAMKVCDVYFKTNLHRDTLREVLIDAGEPELERKVHPFFSFAGYLGDYLKPSPLRDLYDRVKGRSEEVCDVVGVYEHLRREGETSVYAAGGPGMTASRAHYWARVHTKQALEAAGLRGTLRLTSRYQRDLEDGELIFPNLSQRAYRRAILRARMLVINTLPHALLPWKATESLALERPFIVDVPPLTEMPAPFQLRRGDHFLSLLPETSFSSVGEGRVLHRFSIDDFQAGADRVAEVFRDKDRLRHMEEQVKIYRRRALNPETLAAYVCDTVEQQA